MPNLFGSQISRADLLARVGDLSQVAGVTPSTLSDGWGRGVRKLDVRTGSGLRYEILLDRGADVGLCEIGGMALCWMPPMRFPGPWYFDPTGDGWLRTGLGGLFNTAGLTHIGSPTDDDIPEYRRPGNPPEHFGTHGRAAHIPAELISSDLEWTGDECEIHATARVRQATSYGENLVMTRRYASRLGESALTVTDTIVNDGYNRTYFAMLYHFNVGYPLLDAGAFMIAPVKRVLGTLFSPSSGSDDFFRYPAPLHDHTLQSAEFELTPDADGMDTVAVVNPALAGGLAMSVTWEHARMPVFHSARVVSEGLYFVGLEPTTNQFGRQDQKRAGLLRMLDPGESVRHELRIRVHRGPDELARLVRASEGQLGG
jgi:galactose mutarotase-like enzyme